MYTYPVPVVIGWVTSYYSLQENILDKKTIDQIGQSYITVYYVYTYY